MLPVTERLSLRRLAAADLDALYRLDSDPTVMRHVRAPLDYEATRHYLAEVVADYHRLPGLGRWAVVERATGALVGVHLLKPLDESAHIEVGYRYFPECWGRGYATEMTRALLGYGFGPLGLRQIVGITHPDNLASQHVLEKCGLRFQGLDCYYGALVRFYALDAADFRAVSGLRT